jgi:hypothetical protein
VSPGAFPHPFARLKKRTLAYTRPRRRRGKKRATHAERVHHEVVIFDRNPVEFPVASIVPHDARDHSLALVGGLRRWLAARWSWLRPRMVPVVASVVGTSLVIASANYLTHAHGAPIHGHVSCSISQR